jgi:hypothetical protein
MISVFDSLKTSLKRTDLRVSARYEHTPETNSKAAPKCCFPTDPL